MKDQIKRVEKRRSSDFKHALMHSIFLFSIAINIAGGKCGSTFKMKVIKL